MRLKPGVIAHWLCIPVVLFLAAFILREEIKYHNSDLTDKVISALDISRKALRKINNDHFYEVKRASLVYRNPSNAEYFNRAREIKALTETALVWIDSLELFQDQAFADDIGDRLVSFRQQIFALSDKAVLELPVFYNGINTDHWLSHAIKSITQNDIQILLAQLRTKIILTEAAALEYCTIKTGGVDIHCWSRFELALNCTTISPRAGELIEADVYLSTYLSSINDIQLLMDGEELKTKEGIATIRTRYSKPGIYPLNFTVKSTNPITDSVITFQKTFFLKVSN